MHAVERADRHAAPLAALDVGRRVTFTAAKPSALACGQHGQRARELDQRRLAWRRAARGRPLRRSARLAALGRRDGVLHAERPDRRAPQLQAVGVAEVGDQRAHVRARAAFDLIAGALQPGCSASGSRQSCSKRWTVTIRSGISSCSPRRARLYARSPSIFTAEWAGGRWRISPVGSARRIGRQAPGLGDLALGVARARGGAEPRDRLIALGQLHQLSLGLRRACRRARAAAPSRTGRACRRAPCARPPSARRTAATTSCEVIPAGLSISSTPSIIDHRKMAPSRAESPRRSGERRRRRVRRSRRAAARRSPGAGTRSAPRAASVVEKPAARRCPPPPCARAITDTSTSSSVARSETLRWPRRSPLGQLAHEHRDLRALHRAQLVDDPLGVAVLGARSARSPRRSAPPASARRRRSAAVPQRERQQRRASATGISSYSRR